MIFLSVLSNCNAGKKQSVTIAQVSMKSPPYSGDKSLIFIPNAVVLMTYTFEMMKATSKGEKSTTVEEEISVMLICECMRMIRMLRYANLRITRILYIIKSLQIVRRDFCFSSGGVVLDFVNTESLE